MSPDRHWIPVARRSIDMETAPFAALTVVSGTRGWGKTEWMDQYKNHLRATTELQVQELRTRRELEQALDHTPSSAVAIFSNGVLASASDPLWESVYRFFEQNPTSILVLSCIDRLSQADVEKYAVHEVYEPDLAFTADELNELLELNGVVVDAHKKAILSDRLRGHPYLVRRQVKQWEASPSSGAWLNPDHPTERLLIRQFESFGPHLQLSSQYLQILRDVARFRRFDASMLLSQPSVKQIDLERQFERLEMSPLGRFDIDPTTKRPTFEWSGRTWDGLRATFPADHSPEAYQAAFKRTRDSGSVTMALFYLLQARRYDDAESFVDAHLDAFLLHTPTVTAEAIWSLPQLVLQQHPHLALLGGLLGMRAGRNPTIARSGITAAAQLLAEPTDGSPLEQFRRAVRGSLAFTALGDRGSAQRILRRASALVGTAQEPGGLLKATTETGPPLNLMPDLAMTRWVASQVDSHEIAVQMSTAMEYMNALTGRSFGVTKHSVFADEIFSGLPLDGAVPDQPGTVSSTSEMSDPLVLLDQGRGTEALEMVRAVATIRNTAPTRSALEAMALIVRALEAPRSLSLPQIEDTVRRSREFWNDEIAGGAIIHAASFAYLALQRPDLARQVQAYGDSGDWYVRLAYATERLVAGNAVEALEVARQLCEEEQEPRALTLAGVMAAAALGDLDQASACAQLRTVWDNSTPELVRFAMRFVPQEQFTKLQSCLDLMPDDLATVVNQAASDPKVLEASKVLPVSKSEQEVLDLLRTGKTYAEIADARFVSMNTVRTQVKGIYRKLGVKDRTEAVTRAEHLGLLK